MSPYAVLYNACPNCGERKYHRSTLCQSCRGHESSPSQRFWAKVTVPGPVPDYAPQLGPCWDWTGALSHGYGHFCKLGAHRWAYEEVVGPIPDGLQLDHLCRRPCCVNPSHLEPVTAAENGYRGFGPFAANARKTHCHRGHELAGTNVVMKQGARHCRVCLRVREEERTYRPRHQTGCSRCYRTMTARVDATEPVCKACSSLEREANQARAVELAAEGRHSKEIARELGLHPFTVRCYLKEAVA